MSGTYAYGYRPDAAAPGTLVIHEEEAGVVRMIYQWLTEEQRSIRSMVTELRRLGIRPRRGPAWAPSSLRNLLTNPIYAGRAYFNRREVIPSPRTGKLGTGRRMRPETEWIAVPVPSIVSLEAFEQAQQQLARNRATLSGRPGHRFYLLRGLLQCGACGRKIFGIPSHGRRIYKCSGRDRLRGDARCRAETISAETLEAFIWGTVVGVLKDPAVLSEKLEAHKARLGAQEVEVRTEAEHLARQLADLERQEQRLLDLYLEEQLAVPSLKTRLAELVTRTASVEERLATTRRVADHQQAHQDAIRRFCAQALRGLAKLT